MAGYKYVYYYYQVLEKMRPIDRKLKYQIDKLIRTAKTGVVGECVVTV